MSAITGIFYPDGRPVERATIERMVATLGHRGPDGSGAWSEGPIGLGHQMLWTTPESLHERLPFSNERGDLTITADARIDNRDELMSALGIPDRQIADSQVILAAYERWGEDCPKHLIGDFAFAIWDARRQALFCARDHFGVKPFYYHHRLGQLFAFGSEIKAFLCLAEVPRRLNELMVAYYLLRTFEDKEITFYQDIVRLPPAHRMIVSRDGFCMDAYWSLDPTYELRLGSDEEYAAAFREIFTEAVRCRLRSAFPVGSTLSGGLDSSSVSCVARNLLASNGPGPLHTFSAVFDDVPESDERPFIQAVLSQGGFEAHFTHPDRMSPLDDWDRVLWHMDEAPYVPNLFMFWDMYRTAQEQSVRVILDGLEGDSTVSYGTTYLTELTCAWKWGTFVAEANALNKRVGYSRLDLFRVCCLRLLFPASLRSLWRAFRRNKIIDHGFARRIHLVEIFRSLEKDQLTPPRTARKAHYYELSSGLTPYTLEVIDKAAAALAVETRHPFYDRRLVDFCLSLPPEQKLSDGWHRIIIRKAMTGVLPAEIQWRIDKADLSANFCHGLITFKEPLIHGIVQNIPHCILGYVNSTTLRDVCRRFISLNNYQDGLAVWDAVTLALWLGHSGLAP